MDFSVSGILFAYANKLTNLQYAGLTKKRLKVLFLWVKHNLSFKIQTRTIITKKGPGKYLTDPV